MATVYIRTHTNSIAKPDCVRDIARGLVSKDPRGRNESHFRPIVNAALHLLDDSSTWELLHEVNAGQFRDSLGKSQIISNTVSLFRP